MSYTFKPSRYEPGYDIKRLDSHNERKHHTLNRVKAETIVRELNLRASKGDFSIPPAPEIDLKYPPSRITAMAAHDLLRHGQKEKFIAMRSKQIGVGFHTLCRSIKEIRMIWNG